MGDSEIEKWNLKRQGLDTAKLFYIGFSTVREHFVIDDTGRRTGVYMLIVIQWLSWRVHSVTNKLPSENCNGKLVSWHQLCTLLCPASVENENDIWILLIRTYYGNMQKGTSFIFHNRKEDTL